MTGPLLTLLEARARSRGLVLASERTLLRELRIEPEDLQTTVASLAAQGAIEVLAPLPFLVARLGPSWSGRSRDRAKSAAKTVASDARGYSYSFQQQSMHLNQSYSYRQPADAEDALLREILQTLGEQDPASFRGALRRFSPKVIRTALERVRRAKAVRTNRTALFRYLLPRLANELRSIH